MAPATPISYRNLLPCLFALLATNCLARKWLKKHEVPPAEVDDQGCQCLWTTWMNNDDFNVRIGDDNTYDNLRRSYNFCLSPRKIKCRSAKLWHVPFRLLRVRDTTCSVETGLKCVSKPFTVVRETREIPHLCDDFEITVQCCSCPTTTAPPETTVAMMDASETTEPPPGRIQSLDTEVNDTERKEKLTSGEQVPITIILIAVIGGIVIIGFVTVIWIVLTKSTLRNKKKKIPQQNFYQEAPMNNLASSTRSAEEPLRLSVSLVQSPNESSDFMTTSSDDEGYRSRPNYNRKRRTKGQRNRILNNGNGRTTQPEHTSDSLEFPTLSSRSPTDENSDEGRLRKWFPDEYERALEQKKRQPQSSTKSRSIFNSAFNASNRKSLPYADDDS